MKKIVALLLILNVGVVVEAPRLRVRKKPIGITQQHGDVYDADVEDFVDEWKRDLGIWCEADALKDLIPPISEGLRSQYDLKGLCALRNTRKLTEDEEHLLMDLALRRKRVSIVLSYIDVD